MFCKSLSQRLNLFETKARSEVPSRIRLREKGAKSEKFSIPQKDGDEYFSSLELVAPSFLSQRGRQNEGLVEVQCTVCLGKCTGSRQNTMHTCMYKDLQKWQESHCWEQFERRADLPDEEVDVLFLQRNTFYFFSFYVEAI